MKDKKVTDLLAESNSPILLNSVPVKMLVACFGSCILGAALMAVLSHYLLMTVLIGILICVCITTPLLAKGKISVNTACLVPMLLICFLYTPISWFTFDGLLGCTPYLSILFITIITLTYYRKMQVIMLSLYAALLLGLTVHWLLAWTGAKDMEQVVNILVAYALTAVLNYSLIEGVKRRNRELNRHITNISLHDDLTGLLNRRAIEDILGGLESGFSSEGTDYAIVMMDVDKLKSINDFFGHNLGDAALKSMAASVLQSIRPQDYAFRFGGDEFLLLLPRVTREAVRKICERIEAGMRGIQGYAFPLTVSTGYALRSESTNSAEVLNLADQLMYASKKGKNGHKNATK